MIISRERIAGSYISFNTKFNEALGTFPQTYKEIVTELPSSNAVETYNWLGLLPKLVKWIGERQVHKLRAESFTIANADWAIGIEVTRDDLDDDRRLGLVQMRINGLGQAALNTIDDEVARILNNAFTALGGLAYDGQFLVDTDHTAMSVGGSSQSNKGTAVLATASFEAAYVAMMGRTDEHGNNLGMRPTHLVCGLGAWPTARVLLEQETVANGSQNMNAGLVKLVLNPKITGNKWFLVDMNQGIGPIIVQVRRDPTLRILNETSEAFYFRKDLNYGVDMSFGTGLGPWQTIWGSDGTV